MKGLELPSTQYLTSMILIGFFIVAILFFLNYYVQANAILKSSDVERHALFLGNLYLSSDKLDYTVGKTLSRDVFSADKLNKEMINQNNLFSYTKIFSDSDVFSEISYPNSIVFLYVQDAESNDRWFLNGHGTLQVQGFSYDNYETCLLTKLKLDPRLIARLFMSTSSAANSPQNIIKSFWDSYDFSECESSLNATVGSVIKTFPVAIRTSNGEVHEGYFVVGLREL